MLNYKKATINDIKNMSSLIREEDAKELKVLGYNSIYKALLDCLNYSDECHIAYDDSKEYVAIFGVCGGLGYGIPFLLCTHKISNHKKELFIKSKKIISIWLNTYKYLHNYISPENYESMKLVKKLGFIFSNVNFKKYKIFYKEI